MVEPMMYGAIGFLAAALLAMLFIPLVHGRAVRLTTRRLDAGTPLTIAEIRAEKDQQRAEYAIATRRLELSLEQMQANAAAQLTALGKKNDLVNQLEIELDQKTADMIALEERYGSLQEQIRATEQELEETSIALRDAERALANKEADFGRVSASLGDQSVEADSQRLELASLRTQVEALKVSVSDYERTIRQTEERLDHERSETAIASKELAAARDALDQFDTRTRDLERQLLSQSERGEWLDKRVQYLEERLAEQGRLLAERDYEIDRLGSEVEAATKSALPGAMASAGRSGDPVAETFQGAIGRLEAQLASANEDRSKLQSEIVAMKRDAESTGASERVENALLREQINDIAAEVARLTAALEGPGSPIEAMLATPGPMATRAATAAINGRQPRDGTPAGIEPARERTLADRIRALQASASRVAQSN